MVKSSNTTDTIRMATNASVRAAIDGLKEIIGDNGTRVVFKKAGLSSFLENPPAYDFNPCITSEDQAKVFLVTTDIMGIHGAKNIFRRIGVRSLTYSSEMGRVFDVFLSLPERERFQKCLETFSLA